MAQDEWLTTFLLSKPSWQLTGDVYQYHHRAEAAWIHSRPERAIVPTGCSRHCARAVARSNYFGSLGDSDRSR